MHDLTLWAGNKRKVVLAGIATIQWESARSAHYARSRLSRYMGDLVDWAREEAETGQILATTDHVETVRFGSKNIARFLYIRQVQFTLVFFLDALLREPEQPAPDEIGLRH